MSHKHSSSVPSTPASHVHTPVSPSITRSAKTDAPRNVSTAPPVTPQRIGRQNQNHYQANIAQFRSPLTPSTPYTPLSLRSFSSNGSSTLTTPSSIKRLSFPNISPEVKSSNSSLADIAQNWRSRASENGIKVSSPSEGDFGDDEASDNTLSEANDSGFITTAEALLPPPFLSSRRRAQSLSLAYSQNDRPQPQSPVSLRSHRAPVSPQLRRIPTSPQTRRSSVAPISPQATRTPARRTLAALNTPPPNRTMAQQLKLKGSFTDPAHTRRRPPFGQIPQTDLCDINEDDYENEYEYGNESHEYAPYPQYPQSFVPQLPPTLHNVNDPFRGSALSSISESIENPFHEYNQHQNYVYGHQLQYQDPNPNYFPEQYPEQYYGYPPANYPSIPVPVVPNTAAPMAAITTKKSVRPATSTCSVCDRKGSLAVLEPCGHPLCSACLTSALNIVGEKDMECAVCKQGVADFKLSGPAGTGGTEEDMSGKSFMDPLFSSPSSVGSERRGRVGGLLPSAFEFGGTAGGNDGFGFFDGVRASTPKGDKRGVNRNDKERCVVLRIDNVPWDITPPTIQMWLQQPVERVHVLLDRKGKTMSHAFVEVEGEEIARAVLRGEVGRGKGGRGSVLGKGRRARGVTVTRSGQEELMRALFPAWRGNFDGSRPSLAGLDNGHVITTLESGLMTEGEITALLHLIKSPDSHFLKVPCLPFYSLISILSKFPADVDSRVFWSGALRDLLYDVTVAAIQVLVSRVEKSASASQRSESEDHEEDAHLLKQLVHSAAGCRAFTTEQIATFSDLLEISSQTEFSGRSVSSSGSSNSASIRTPDIDENRSQILPRVQTPTETSGSMQTGAEEPFDALAREFGIEAQLVHALAQRLSVLA